MSQLTNINNLDDLLNRLKGVKRVKDNSYLARCPAHEDHNPSLSIKLSGDKILLNCLAGCDTDKVLKAINLTMADLFLDKKDASSKRIEKSKVKGKIEKIYQYCDEQSKVIFEVVRYKPKDFSFRRPDGKGGYIDNIEGIQRVIYRLPQIKAAAARKDLICHVEGEKDADNLVNLGMEATTSPMGAKAWRTDFARYYAGAKLVVIFPDNDESGQAYAQKVAQDVSQIAEAVKIVDLPGDGVKDVSNWIEAGGTREQLESLIDQAPQFKPVKVSESVKETASLDELLKQNSAELYCILNGSFHRIAHTDKGDLEIPICNFTAQVIEDILKDDGLQTSRYLKIKGNLFNGQPLKTVTIPESSFDGMKWARPSWGVKTHIDARRSSNEHLRNSIELISDKAVERTIYTHTGWREIDGQMVYLTNGSAIGKLEIEAEMDFQLSRYYLPQPEGDPKTAIEKSFEFLYIGELPVTLPLLTAVYLAPLNPFLETCFTLWYVGPTGALKSVLSGLALSHYGNFNHKTLPASWRDTKNQLEKLLFLAKDILLVIDDWAPAEDLNSMREMESKAEYIIRAQGNRQAKGRMKPNMSSQTIFIPRGMLLSSGEQLPSGQSRNARVLPVRIEVSSCLPGKAVMPESYRSGSRERILTWITLPKPKRIRVIILRLCLNMSSGCGIIGKNWKLRFLRNTRNTRSWR
jgi:hypothetical protein